MKCEKHNVDMYWKGDLRNGSMHCDSCEDGEIDFPAPTEALKELLSTSQQFTIDPKHYSTQGGAPIPDPRANAPIGRGTVDPYQFHDEVSFRRARFDAANRALRDWNTGGHATCEYCGKYDGPVHMNSATCESDYWGDEKFLRARGIRI